SKIVEAEENNEFQINGALGAGSNTLAGDSGVHFSAGFNGGSTSSFQDFTLNASGDTQGGGTFAFAPQFGFLTDSLGLEALNLRLNILENAKKIKVVSSPRTVVLNGRQAILTHTTPIATSVLEPESGV